MSDFVAAIRDKDFALCAELPLTPDSHREKLVRDAVALGKSVDAIYVPDNRFGRVHMSSLAAAAILKQHSIDVVMELSCRHRSRGALLSDLLGARELGVSSLMLVRGKSTPEELKAEQQFMVDTDVVELLGVAQKVYRDEFRNNADDFVLGTMANIHEPRQNQNTDTLNGKIDAGAQLFQTQLCLNIDLLTRYMRHLRQNRINRSAYIVVGTSPIPSYDLACELKENQSHLRIPDSVLHRLKHATDERAEGIAICAEFLQQLKDIPGVSGARIFSPTDIETIPLAIEQAGLTPQ
ncbi:MAG: methylenetetrahydrofolate reductase [Pseudomonadales bacterium]